MYTSKAVCKRPKFALDQSIKKPVDPADKSLYDRLFFLQPKRSTSNNNKQKVQK